MDRAWNSRFKKRKGGAEKGCFGSDGIHCKTNLLVCSSEVVVGRTVAAAGVYGLEGFAFWTYIWHAAVESAARSEMDTWISPVLADDCLTEARIPGTWEIGRRHVSKISFLC